jgi:hypothetical protein
MLSTGRMYIPLRGTRSVNEGHASAWGQGSRGKPQLCCGDRLWARVLRLGGERVAPLWVPSLSPVGERVARPGALFSRGGPGEGVASASRVRLRWSKALREPRQGGIRKQQQEDASCPLFS